MSAPEDVALLAPIQIYRGTDVTIAVGPIQNAAGNNIDWTGYTINMAITARPGASSLLTRATGGSGITISTTVFTIVLTDTETAGLTAGEKYWEVQATTGTTTIQVIDCRSVCEVLNSTL